MIINEQLARRMQQRPRRRRRGLRGFGDEWGIDTGPAPSLDLTSDGSSGGGGGDGSTGGGSLLEAPPASMSQGWGIGTSTPSGTAGSTSGPSGTAGSTSWATGLASGISSLTAGLSALIGRPQGQVVPAGGAAPTGGGSGVIVLVIAAALGLGTVIYFVTRKKEPAPAAA